MKTSRKRNAATTTREDHKSKSRVSMFCVLLSVAFFITILVIGMHMFHVSNILDPIHISSSFLVARTDRKVQLQPPSQQTAPDLPQASKQQDIAPSIESQPAPAPIVPTSSPTILPEENHNAVGDSSGIHPSQSNNHKILTLSDNDFLHTSFSDMMRWYENSDPVSCSGDFGNQLIDNWRGKRESFCSTYGASSSSSPVSSIDCYLMHQTRHHGSGDNLCLMRNVSVQLGIFGDAGFTTPVVEKYVQTMHNEQPYCKFGRGFIKGTCATQGNVWVSAFFPGWNSDWTTSAYEMIQPVLRGAVGSLDGLCDEWVEHPTLIVQRDTFANFFHDSEDFFNVFVALAVLKWNRADTQIMLTDLYPKGPFWEIWAGPYSGGYPTIDAWDIAHKYGKTDKGREHRVCFRELAIGIYGPAAPITVASWDTKCFRTALVRAYSDFVIRGLNLQSNTHYFQPTPSKTVVITYLARRASTEWPEKRYCDDEKSFFFCKLWKKFGIRSLGRMIRNDKEVVDGLARLQDMTFPNGAKVKFQDVDYNVLSLRDQIKVDLETDIMVGPHGAGLMHNIFMRDRAILLELHIDGSGANRHFHNLAWWYGRKYVTGYESNPVNVNQLQKDLERLVGEMDLSSY